MTQLAIHGGSPACTTPWPKWPLWDDREKERLLTVLESGEWGGFNPMLKEFEATFAKRHQAKHCLTLVNGTLSLEAALRAVGVEHGDEVIVPPYTFIATANAVRLIGAIPVFVDVEPDTYNLDISRIEEAISPKTKAVIPVHFAGLMADMDALLPLAKQHNLAIIEDAAHAHGSTWRGQPAGTLGDIGSFSLQQSKNLTSGEGGILLTNSDALKEKLWSYINQGRSLAGAWYEHANLGSNLRMTGWQAAILIAQMERFDEQLQRRMSNARRLNAILEEIDGLQAMHWDDRADNHAFHLYMMRYDAQGFAGLSRNRFVEALRAEGVPCSTGYARPLYRQPPLTDLYSRIMPCPVSEKACQEAIWLTQNMLLAEPEQIDRIAEAIVKVKENVESLKG